MIDWDKTPKMRKKAFDKLLASPTIAFEVADFKAQFKSAFPMVPEEYLVKVINDCINQSPIGSSIQDIENRIKLKLSLYAISSIKRRKSR